MMLTAPSLDVLPFQQQMIQEPMLSEEYEFPINKTSRVITLPSLLYVSLDDKRNAINYFGHAKDGMEFKINVGFDVKEENVALVIQCTPSAMQLDQSKIYKLSSSILWKNNKKQQKDVKIEAKENQIRMPIAQKLREQQIILINEIIIEVSAKYNSRDEVGFTGIVNNAATCYMNSVFQILFHLGAFQQLVYNIVQEDHNQFPCTLQNLFYNLKHSKIAVSTQEIIKSFKWDVDQQAIQQDVQEFIMELLKAIGTKAPQIEHQIIDLFQGELENHIQNQNFDKSNVEQFMDISLNITNSLEESLNLFISTELLEGENSYNHDELGKQEAVKYHLFKKLPPILLINLKRYRYEDGGFQKIHDSFQYNEEFNFKQYLVNKEDSLYELYAVLVHRGEAINHGHYYCYIKPFYQCKQWFKFDDKIVTRATNKEVFQNNFGGQYEEIEYNHDLNQILTEQKNIPETAYMLVYIQKNAPYLLEQPKQYPQWIIDQEEKIQEMQNQKKNFIQTNIFTIDHLNLIQCSNIKTGIIFHRQAVNQSIDLIAIEEFFDKYTTPALIPKNIQIQQLVESLSEKIGVDKNQLLLFLYKISNNKANIEQLILMQPQKQFSFYSSQKIYQFGLLLISTKFEDQILINNYLGVDQLKIDQIQSNGKTQKEPQQEGHQLVIIKTSQNKNIEINQFLLVQKGSNIQEIITEKFNNKGENQLYFQNDALEFKKENAIFKNSEYIQVYIDTDNTLENELIAIQNRREVIVKLIPENQCTSQIFDKNDLSTLLLNYIAQIEECCQDNIQIKYKDKKGNYQTLMQQMRIEEMIQYDSTITYKQTILPVGAMKEQMSFQVEGQNYIIFKSMSFQEFMDQENLIDTIPLLQSKKDKKAAWVLLDRSEKISRACVKNTVQFTKPIILGQDLYIVCFLQSVEIILLCNPLVCQVAKTCTIQEILYALLQQISQNPITYKTQQIQIMQDCILSTDDDKTKKLELLMRLKINNQEIQQDIPAQIGSLQFEENQITLVITFLTIRDNKTDKLRQKGVQIL